MTLSSFNPDISWRSIIQDPDWMYKMGIGGAASALSILLFAISFLLLPLAFLVRALLFGYLLRIIRTKEADAQCQLPHWNDLVELIFSGLAWLAVESTLYVGLLGISALAFVFCSTVDFLNPLISNLVTGLVSVLVVGLWLTVSFFIPFLMVNFALEERFSAGFAFRKVFSIAKSQMGTFIVCWLLILGVKIAAVILPILTLIGIFFMPTTIFFAQVLSANMAIQAWRETSSNNKQRKLTIESQDLMS